MIHIYKKTLIILFLLLVQNYLLYAQSSGFINELITSETDSPVGLTFSSNGDMYVWEKAGRLYLHTKTNCSDNKYCNRRLLLDISEEVLNFIDHGLNGFSLDPNFDTNRFIYLLYVADRNYIDTYGTPNYNQSKNDKFEKATVGRIVRYKLNNTFTGIESGSKFILLGETLDKGIPITMDNHGVGSLVFAKDGSLLFSVGDVAFIGNDETNIFFQEALNVGIMTSQTRIGPFRSQEIKSLNGKVNRINPSNGEGYPSNPFFAANNPKAPESMVWSLGLRNPFRFSIKPGTGSTNPADGDVGILYIGDVGWAKREELNVATQKGMNFGWPIFEGDLITGLSNQNYSLTTSEKAKILWRGPIAQSYINNEYYAIGSPQFTGNDFTGTSSIGGIWYEGSAYPLSHRNQYFMGDYASPGWIKGFKFNSIHEATQSTDYFDNVHPTCFAINPIDQSIYYTNYEYPNTSEIRKILYDPNYNNPPKSIITFDKNYGNSPLNIQFNGSASYDPEGGNISYFWNFGDDNYSQLANPNHTFYSSTPKVFSVSLTVTDASGKSTETKINININNTAPIISSTSVDNFTYFPNKEAYTLILSASVSDNEESANAISHEWLIALHHEDHAHSLGNVFGKTTKIRLDPVPCDGQEYFYRITLKATDKYGISSTKTKDIFPICNYPESNPPHTFGIQGYNITETSAILTWETPTDESEIWAYEILKNNISLGIVNANKNSFEVNNLIFNNEYKFKIKAIDKYGNFIESSDLAIKTSPPCASQSKYLSDIDWSSAENGNGPPEKDLSNGRGNPQDGSLINILGEIYEKGIGTFPYSKITYNIGGIYKKLRAELGLDFSTTTKTCGSVVFKIEKNGTNIYDSGIIKNSGREIINIDISNASQISLILQDAGDNNWCDEGNWGNILLSSCPDNANTIIGFVQNIQVTKPTANEFVLSWNGIGQNLSTITYTIFIDGAKYANTNNTSIALLGISSGLHTIAIQAKDTDLNTSISKQNLFKFCPEKVELSGKKNEQLPASYTAEKYIISNYILENQPQIHYEAGSSIILNPGTSISNSTFKAEIKNCMN